MPSQSRLEGVSTSDHWMVTLSPDRLRVLGETERDASALAEEVKIERKRMMEIEKLTIIAIKCLRVKKEKK